MSLLSKRKYYIVKDGITLELRDGVVQDPSSGTMSRLSFFYQHKDGAVHINFNDVVKEMRMQHPQMKSRLTIEMDPLREVTFPVSVGDRLIKEVRTLTKSLMSMGRLLHDRLLSVRSPLSSPGSGRRKLIDKDITALQTKLRQIEEKERKAMENSPSKVKYKSLIGREITIDDERMDLISNFARHHTNFIEYRGRSSVSPDTFDKDINYCNKFLYHVTPMVVIEMQDLIGMMEEINGHEDQADDKRIFAANLGLIDIKLKEFMEQCPRQSRRIENQEKKRTLFTNKSFLDQNLSSSESSDAEIREIPRVQTPPPSKQNVVKRTELAKNKPKQIDTMFHDKADKKKQKSSKKSSEIPDIVTLSDTSSDTSEKSLDISYKLKLPLPPKQNIIESTELTNKQLTPRPTRSRNDGTFLMIDEEHRVIPMTDTMFHEKEDKRKQKSPNKSFKLPDSLIDSATSSNSSSKKRKRKNEEKENQSNKVTVEADIEVCKTSQEGSRIKPIAKSTSILSVIPHTQKSAKVNHGHSTKALNEIRKMSTDSDSDFLPNRAESRLEKRSITYHSSSSDSDYNNKRRRRSSNSAASGRDSLKKSKEDSKKRPRKMNSSILQLESSETDQEAPNKIPNSILKNKPATHSTPIEQPKNNKSSPAKLKKQFSIKSQFGHHSFDDLMQKDHSQDDGHPRRSLAVNNYNEKNTRCQYKVYEDRIILAWVMKSKNNVRVMGNIIWKELEDKKFTTDTRTVRTWQSLKNRFLKHILPNLHDYGLRYDEEKSLRIAAARGTLKKKYPLVAKKSVPGFSLQNKPSTSRGVDAINNPYTVYQVDGSDSDDPISYKEFKRLSIKSKGRRRTLFTDTGFISQ